MGGFKNNDFVDNVTGGGRQNFSASSQAVMKSVFINLLDKFFNEN